MLRWVDVTHEIEGVGMGGVVSRCVRLPYAGAIADQPAHLWDALTIVRQTHNQVLGEQARKATR